MATFKGFITILSTMNKSHPSKNVTNLLPILKTMETNPNAKGKLKNDNWLAENVYYVLYGAQELMTHPNNHLLKKYILSLHPDNVYLADFILKEFITIPPAPERRLNPNKK